MKSDFLNVHVGYVVRDLFVLVAPSKNRWIIFAGKHSLSCKQIIFFHHKETIIGFKKKNISVASPFCSLFDASCSSLFQYCISFFKDSKVFGVDTSVVWVLFERESLFSWGEATKSAFEVSCVRQQMKAKDESVCLFLAIHTDTLRYTQALMYAHQVCVALRLCGNIWRCSRSRGKDVVCAEWVRGH